MLGYAQLETTRSIYLAPVVDLQLRSLLGDFAAAPGPLPEDALTRLFKRMACESEGIQDLEDRPVGR